MKWLCSLLLVLLLPSCGLFGGGSTLSIPVSETETIAGFAGQAGWFDRNGNGVLDEGEAEEFLAWFSFQVLNTFLMPGPIGPIGPAGPSTTPGT